MTLLRKLSIATAGASAIFTVFSVPVSAFTISQPTGAAWDFYDPLGGLPSGATGEVKLNPTFFVGYLTPPAAGSTFFTQFAADAVSQFPGWTTVSGAPLGGLLAIDEYDARDYVAEPEPQTDTPRGGADMRATYTRTATDPMIADLRFIQMFTDNYTDDGGLRSQIDRLDADERTDQLPWYFSDTKHTEYSIPPNSIIFEDIPSDPVTTIPFNRTVRFETYLATFDNTTKVATIRDGWRWGYDVQATQAVPEPLTILSSAVALGFGASFKKEFSRRRNKNPYPDSKL